MNTEVLEKVFTPPSAKEKPAPITPTLDDHAYLIASGPLAEYRDFLMKERADWYSGRTAEIEDEWRIAALVMLQYRSTESGFADDVKVQPLPDELRSLAPLVEADPIYRRAFQTVPAEIGWVELDRLVVRQNLIDLTQVARIKERLGPQAALEEVFRLCLPYDHPTTAHRTERGQGSFTFTSDSNDIRFLEAVLLGPEQVKGYQAQGPIVGIVGIVVGYGSNYLNVIAAENRLVLHNGCHRAYALREMGITHVPCVVQRVANRKALAAVATGTLRRKPDFYLKEPRPPSLKDFFDPALRKIVALPRTVRQVKVRFTTEMVDTSAG